MSAPGRGALVFVCDDDLWSVSADGGTARRLTAGLGEPSTPCLSPDGRWIAYVGRDEQHPEVYVMPAEGGPARRLTFLGPDVMVRGWTRDGHILFVTTQGQPFFRNYRAHTIDPAGGLPRRLSLAWYAQWQKGGAIDPVPVLVAGERWRLVLRLKRPHGTVNPDGFDVEAWLLENNLRATGYVRRDDDDVPVVAELPQFLRRTAVLEQFRVGVEGIKLAGPESIDHRPDPIQEQRQLLFVVGPDRLTCSLALRLGRHVARLPSRPPSSPGPT